MDTPAADIDGYLAALPDDAREALSGLRRSINSFVPGAVESISYGMPTFKYRGRPLIYFMAAKKHCAIYGTSRGTIRFQPSAPPSEAELKTLLQDRLTTIEADAADPKRGKSRP